MAADLTESEFAALIGVPLEQLAVLEREGLESIAKSKGKPKRFPVPAGVRWFIEYSIARRVGGIPPRANQQDFAQLVGIVPRQVKNLVDVGTLTTVIERGRRLYPLPLAVHEFIKHREEQSKGRKSELTALDEARLRKLNAEADKAEMEALQKRGESIDRVTSQRGIGEVLQALRSQLTQIPGRHDRKLVGLSSAARARKVLKEIVNGELVRLGAAVAAVGRRIQVVAEDLSPDVDDSDPAPESEVADG